MPTQAGPARRRMGIALMAVSMLAVPTIDALAKHLGATYSPLFIGWMRYVTASLIVVPVTLVVRGRPLLPTERLRSHAFRTLCLVITMTLFFLALTRVPLATATSASLVGPIVAVALAALLLRERLTPAKLLGLGSGIVGSLVFLRPGGAPEPGVLLAMGAGVVFALYLVATRHAAQVSDPLQTLTFQCLLGTLLLTPLALFTWRVPAAHDLLFVAGLGLSSAFCHLLSISAFRLADASTLAPLVYLELVGSALLGYLVFEEVPSARVLVGAGFIVAAGLILLADERRVPR